MNPSQFIEKAKIPIFHIQLKQALFFHQFRSFSVLVRTKKSRALRVQVYLFVQQFQHHPSTRSSNSIFTISLQANTSFEIHLMQLKKTSGREREKERKKERKRERGTEREKGPQSITIRLVNFISNVLAQVYKCVLTWI